MRTRLANPLLFITQIFFIIQSFRSDFVAIQDQEQQISKGRPASVARARSDLWLDELFLLESVGQPAVGCVDWGQLRYGFGIRCGPRLAGDNA